VVMVIFLRRMGKKTLSSPVSFVRVTDSKGSVSLSHNCTRMLCCVVVFVFVFVFVIFFFFFFFVLFFLLCFCFSALSWFERSLCKCLTLWTLGWCF
jgi:hypothetical protein